MSQSLIEEFAELIPDALRSESGAAFFSGRTAFSPPSLRPHPSMYIVGINPGGCPEKQAAETVEWHTGKVLKEFSNEWSEYRDARWQQKEPGTHGIQPRILHVLRRLQICPSDVPSSNLIFVRTRSKDHLKGRFDRLVDDCWPFHAQVISKLKIKLVLCLGKDVGREVRDRLEARNFVDSWQEKNRRAWRVDAHENPDGLIVVSACHPSRAKWDSEPSDPTPLIDHALRRASASDN